MGRVLPSSEEMEDEDGTIVTLLPRYVLLSVEASEDEDDEESEWVEEDLPPPAQHWTVLSPMQ